MFKLPLLRGISFIFFLLLTSCEEKKGTDPVVQSNEQSLALLEQVKETEDKQEKIRLLNKALRAIEDNRDTLLPELLDFKIYYHNSLKEYDSSLFFTDSLERVATFQKDTSELAKAFYRRSKVKYFTWRSRRKFFATPLHRAGFPF